MAVPRDFSRLGGYANILSIGLLFVVLVGDFLDTLILVRVVICRIGLAVDNVKQIV